MLKIIKLLKEKNIEYKITTRQGFSDIHFIYNGKGVTISEYCYPRGDTRAGILVSNLSGGFGLNDFKSQKKVVEYLNNTIFKEGK